MDTPRFAAIPMSIKPRHEEGGKPSLSWDSVSEYFSLIYSLCLYAASLHQDVVLPQVLNLSRVSYHFFLYFSFRSLYYETLYTTIIAFIFSVQTDRSALQTSNEATIKLGRQRHPHRNGGQQFVTSHLPNHIRTTIRIHSPFPRTIKISMYCSTVRSCPSHESTFYVVYLLVVLPFLFANWNTHGIISPYSLRPLECIQSVYGLLAFICNPHSSAISSIPLRNPPVSCMHSTLPRCFVDVLQRCRAMRGPLGSLRSINPVNVLREGASRNFVYTTRNHGSDGFHSCIPYYYHHQCACGSCTFTCVPFVRPSTRI